jgi:hypothetical protein
MAQKIVTTQENAYEKILLIKTILDAMYDGTERESNDYVQGTLDAIYEVIGVVND